VTDAFPPAPQEIPSGIRLVEGSVTATPGFSAGTVACGIKSEAGTPDLAILVADRPCVVAGTFTTNKAPSHTVTLCRDHLLASGNRGQAVVVNSGNANCANGSQGDHDARQMAALTARKLGLDEQLVYVSSTGIIGRPLPMEKVERGIADVQPIPTGGPAFTRGIMTTDTRPKDIAVELTIDGKTVRIGAATKGSGMIYPNMATMLCYITTDVATDAGFLTQTLRSLVDASFNMICMDGDMSTNDTVLIFASGAAGNAPLQAGSQAAAAFTEALGFVTRYLAREMARDGEGATKLMIVDLKGGATLGDARKAARAVTASPLWQCALAGGDPNWGRVWAALGASGAELNPNKITIALGDVEIVRQGVATGYDQTAARAVMAGTEVTVTVNLNMGAAEATAWGCDLTHGYIDENTLYSR
jgi:glutamate N-acetyltransferase / amino-acid N-acetyltransferase